MKFEDVPVGEEFSLSKGPLTTMHLMRWSAAMENWHRIHYDRDFAVGRDKLPDLLVNGSLKQQFVLQLLKDWAGPEGWVWKAAFRFRSMNQVGETLRVWARVTEKRKAAAYGLIDLALGITNERGVESTPGTAVVALPFREGAALPYPFVAPV
ncbi:MAG TPA: acyl dehydratase [Ramlibacter sp.]|uniref:acyl dehydratase n=1 Tax=Ramlibacter sp. TaxID=1917967 RepID=UPI002BCD6CFE|nr:acyl dehydratase [Ramlibacter sp.]HVZ43596.1 acyl dehydratase [Ramlibacter sp.]